MSDSEDFTVTYMEAPPSPHYVPNPEEPEQAPPPPDFVSEPVYPEFMPLEDDVLPAEEQPLPAAVSPTTDSPSYNTEFDPEEDLEEEDNEDHEEDPADYLDDKYDNEEEESSGDDADDEEKDEDEEEEHLAPADSVPPPAYRTTARMSIRDQTPIPFPFEAEVNRLLAISTLPPSPLTSYSSPLPQIPSPPLPVSSPLPMSPPPLPASPTHPLGYIAAMIRLRAKSPSTSHLLPLPPPIVLPHNRASMAMMRAAAPSTYILASQLKTPPSGTPPLLPIPLPTSSPPLLLPSIDCSADVPEVTLPPRKRLCITPGPRYEIGESSSAPTSRPTRGFRADYSFVGTLDAKIRRDPDREIGYRITDDTYEIYGRLDDAQDDRSLMSGQLNLLRRDRRSHACTTRLMEGKAKASREAWVQSMDASDTTRSEAADRRRQAQLIEALTLLRTLQTQMAALHSQQTPARDPTHPDVPEEAGRVSFDVREVFPEESDNIKKYVSGLLDMIHGSVIASKPKIMQDAVEFATELMDKKIRTFAERQVENKRKFEETSGNNQNQQQQNKRQNTGMAYTVRSGEKKPYEGSKPLCSKCNYHHDGQCAPKCHKCNRVGHLARDCRSPANANTANNQRGTRAGQKSTCFECEAQGHFKRECPKLRNNNRGNQDGNGNAPAKVYVVGNVGTNPDSNVVTGTFLLNNRYASILFDTGADRSFVSTAFSSQIVIITTTLDHYYDVELADGRIVSFDVIIGMEWLAKYQAVIVCAKKIIRIPWGNETLTVRRDGSNRGNDTRLNIISCTKMQKYMLKGCHVFLAHVTTKKTEDKSEGKRLKDVPIVRDFPEVFSEDLSGLPPTQQVEFQIDLIPGAAPVARAPYRLAPSEMKELSDQLQELSNKGFIRLSSSPWGAPVLFVKKKDGSF
ncbi:putative reverse transcriptase domain-containing protein [Tanacetum coccineum]